MVLPVENRPLTVEDLYAFPDDAFKYELQAGILLSEPLPGFRHGLVALRMARLLVEHVDREGLGAVVTNDTGFVLARQPDTVRGPDVAFVARARLAQLEDAERAFPGAPDLAVEVLSPSNTPSGVRAKVADYLAAGARLVWVVDSESETVTVYRSLLAPRVLRRDADLDGEDVVPGFRAPVAGLFSS